MQSGRKRLQGRAAAWLLRRIQRSWARLPYEKALARGERLGRLIWRLDSRRRRTGESNLALVYPSMSLVERRDICRRVFENFGRTAADFLIGLGRSYDKLMETTEVRGGEHLFNALKKGKGAMIVTGHFGNWERVTQWVVNNGVEMSVIARDANDAGVNSLVNELRSGPGTKLISRGRAARLVIERLRKNEVVGIVPDQNADDIYLPFFGHLAGTALGPGVFAEKTGAAVVPVFCRHLGGGQYLMEFLPELVAEPGYEKKGEGMMRAINVVLEDAIRKDPDQWLWIHDRWRNARRKGLL